MGSLLGFAKGFCLYSDFRNGNVHASIGLLEQLKYIHEILSENGIKMIYRSDSAGVNLHEKHPNFKVNNIFFKMLKEFKENKRLCWIRILNPNNPKSIKTYFYSLGILEEFDKCYRK